MAHGEFLWCDLATFGVARTLEFYKPLFNWSIKSETFADGSVYHYTSSSHEVTAGVYEMPVEYRNTGMPSFWMSYIGVDDVTESIALAEDLGGKLILGPAMFGHGATIAMVEDPFGAKLTFFSGSHLQPHSTAMVPGSHFWNELYTPDLAAASEFYSRLFNWRISGPDKKGRLRVENLAGRLTTAFQSNKDLPPPLDTSQWTTSFAVASLSDTAALLGGTKGSIVPDVHNAPGNDLCICDPNGAVFFATQVGELGPWFT